MSGAYFIVVHKVLSVFLRTPGKLFTRLVSSVNTNLLEITLVLLAVFLFGSALGRSDWEHVGYSISPLVLLVLHLVKTGGFELAFQKSERLKSVSGIGVVVFVALALGLGTLQAASDGMLQQNFPLDTPDTEFIPRDYVLAIDFLNRNLGPNDDFLTLTSEASWYYFLNKPSPGRFPVIWFAATRMYQDQTVAELQKSNVKFVLYRNEYSANGIDGITMRERMPRIFLEVERTFKPCLNIQGNEIWVRRNNSGYRGCLGEGDEGLTNDPLIVAPIG